MSTERPGGIDRLGKLRMQAPGLIPDSIWNTLIAIIRSLTILPSPDYAITSNATGWFLRIKFPPAAPPLSWAWRCTKLIVGTSAFVQVNGGDGQVATCASITAKINDADNGWQSNDTTAGSPARYPRIAVTANGYIYGKTHLNSDGSVNTSDASGGVEAFFSTTVVADDTASPPTYTVQMMATITGYATNGDGVPDFTLANTSNTGFVNFQFCDGVFKWY